MYKEKRQQKYGWSEPKKKNKVGFFVCSLYIYWEKTVKKREQPNWRWYSSMNNDTSSKDAESENESNSETLKEESYQRIRRKV